jgi:A/G-specific adenine glycosylase
MLQQTRVEAVKPYFDRFMKELPTIKDLAEVEDDRLMKLWEGLGYYSRARNLKIAAQTVMDEYDGQLPADYDQLLSSKALECIQREPLGSIAFDLQVPAVDGNVLRVLARIWVMI